MMSPQYFIPDGGIMMQYVLYEDIYIYWSHFNTMTNVKTRRE